MFSQVITNILLTFATYYVCICYNRNNSFHCFICPFGIYSYESYYLCNATVIGIVRFIVVIHLHILLVISVSDRACPCIFLARNFCGREKYIPLRKRYHDLKQFIHMSFTFAHIINASHFHISK